MDLMFADPATAAEGRAALPIHVAPAEAHRWSFEEAGRLAEELCMASDPEVEPNQRVDNLPARNPQRQQRCAGRESVAVAPHACAASHTHDGGSGGVLDVAWESVGGDTASETSLSSNTIGQRPLLGECGRQLALLEELLGDLVQMSRADALLISRSCMPLWNLTPVWPGLLSV